MELPQGKSVVLFDGVCNFCNNSVQFIIARDPQSKFFFASLQSEIGKSVLRKFSLPEDYKASLLLLQEGGLYKKSDAALLIARELTGGWKAFYVFKFLPAFVRDFFYDIVAKNRYRFFGKSEACMIPSLEIKGRFLE
ncbi:MAG TPA: thiol-disulfide oxidoreductase DCC family protein [Cytophagaceae bacterium]